MGMGTDRELGLYKDKQLTELVPYGQDPFDPSSLFTINIDDPSQYSPEFKDQFRNEKRFSRIKISPGNYAYIEDPKGEYDENKNYISSHQKIKAEDRDITADLFTFGLPDTEDDTVIAGN